MKKIVFDEKKLAAEKKKHKILAYISGVVGIIAGLTAVQFSGQSRGKMFLLLMAAMTLGLSTNYVLKKIFHREPCHLREYLDYCEDLSFVEEKKDK